MCPSLPGWQCRVVVSSDRGFSRRYERLGIPAEPAALDTKTPSGFLFATLVSSQPPVTRFPASECGACFGLPDSPRLRPLAPPPPQGVATSCSQVSQLLWSHLTSSDRTSQFIDFSLNVAAPLDCGQSEDLSGPDEVLLYVPWFLDLGMPSFASP